MRVLLSLLVCLWLVPTTALAQEPADPGPRIKVLIETFEGARDAKKKRECLSELVAIGEPAFKAVETRATELAAKAAAARTAGGDDPDPAGLETLRKLDALTRAAGQKDDRRFGRFGLGKKAHEGEVDCCRLRVIIVHRHGIDAAFVRFTLRFSRDRQRAADGRDRAWLSLNIADLLLQTRQIGRTAVSAATGDQQ